MSHGSDGGLPEEHEEHVNHEAWVIPYADLLTLLMAMFIALFAMSTVDMDKFKALSIGFNEALGGGDLSTGVFDPNDGGTGPLEGGGSGAAPQAGGAIGPDRQPQSDSVLATLVQQYQNRQVAAAAEQESLREVAETIERGAAGSGFAGSLHLRLEHRGLVVTVVTDQVLFDDGSAALRGESVALLEAIGTAMTAIDNPIVIEGHTDSRPIATARFADNRELSSARANAVLRHFESLGIPPAQMQSVGWADLHPVAVNDTAPGRAQNRRVEIVVQSNLIEQALDDADLGATPVTPEDPVGDPVGESVDGGVDPVRPNLGGH